MAIENLQKILDELLEMLRDKLISELGEVECIICYSTVYDRYHKKWVNHHIPYYSIQGGVVKVGYRCSGNPDEPIIVYEISLKELLGEIEKNKTRLLE